MSVTEVLLNPEILVKAVMSRHSRYMDKWCYELGLILKAVEEVYLCTGDQQYIQFIMDHIDRFVGEDGSIAGYDPCDQNLDNINPGKALLFLYEQTSLDKYKKAAQLIREQLNKQPRTPSGGFWHKRIYPYQMWLDGLYMSSPFIVRYAAMFDEPSLFDEANHQEALVYEHTRDSYTGLLFHAWDESRGMKWSDDKTGCSPHFWGRAIGWFVMALVDMLDYLPEGYVNRPRIIKDLSDTIRALIKFQDSSSGVWRQILDRRYEKSNYFEASVSCMVTYVLLKGIRLGYLDASLSYAADAAYKGILGQFVETDDKGLPELKHVCGMAGLGGCPYRDGSLAYYLSEPVITNDYKGFGPLILACVEYQRKENGISRI